MEEAAGIKKKKTLWNAKGIGIDSQEDWQPVVLDVTRIILKMARLTSLKNRESCHLERRAMNEKIYK